jgi:thioredoxin-related protein
MKALSLLVALFPLSVIAQQPQPTPAAHPPAQGQPAAKPHLVKWTSLEEAQAAAKKDGKPLIIDMWTPWCGWCKRLDANTFGDKQTAEYINSHYHPVSFNAEGPDPVTYNGKKYENPTYEQAGGRHGTHQLTLEIAAPGGKLGYPTIVYMDSEGKVIQAVQSYFSPEDIEPILIYFGEGGYKSQDWQTFKGAFKSRRTPVASPAAAP